MDGFSAEWLVVGLIVVAALLYLARYLRKKAAGSSGCGHCCGCHDKLKSRSPHDHDAVSRRH